MRLTIDLEPGDYRQLAAFTQALRREAGEAAGNTVTIESLAGQLLLRGLEEERRAWYRGQAQLAAEPLDIEALNVLTAARVAP